MVTIIDGKGLIHGRLAGIVAKRIMDGEDVVVFQGGQLLPWSIAAE